MSRIEIISTTDFDDMLWRKFFELSMEISRKHYPDTYNKNRTFEEFRKKRIDNAANEEGYGEYVVFTDDITVGWINTSVWNKELSFGFDIVNDEMREDLLKAVLIKFAEIMNEKNFNNALYYTYREAIFTTLKKAGAAVDEEYLISRLERNNMDSKFYEAIIKENNLNNWKLEYYSEIPNNLIEQYVLLHNESFQEMSAINPYPAMVHAVYAEYINVVREAHKKNGIENAMYILFDDNGGIAGLCSILIDKSNMESLSHIGTLTAVTAKHRGKGIAKYLKAKLYLKLLSENKDFKYITTDTMPWNKYMYSINTEFGFTPYMNGCQFKITKEFINNYNNI